MEKEKELRAAGILLFAGASQFFLSMLVAESIYPGYSVSNNYISDLGVGSTALLFNTSIIILGIISAISAYLLRKHSKGIMVTVFLAGIGAAGVGIFPETVKYFHTIFSLVVFLFSSLAAYFVLVRERKAITVPYAVMGSISLVALILYALDIFLGLGKGGMERMIAYPDLFWIASYGGFLFMRKED